MENNELDEQDDDIDEYVSVNVVEKKITVIEAECLRCGGIWHPRTVNGRIKSMPKNCALCNSPYWNKFRLKTGAKNASNKYGFDAIELNKWSYLPFYHDSKDQFGMDQDANARRSRSLEQYMRRKGWSYTHRLGKNPDGEVCLMVMRTK